MPLYLFIYILLLKFLPKYINSIDTYWIMDGVLFLIITIYIFKKEDKNIVNFLSCTGLFVVFIFQIASRFFYMCGVDSNYMSKLLIVLLCFICYILVSKNRYKWRKEKSNNYNRNKVQAIYSKPNDFISLFGAAISLSPKCCVRYTYNDKTIRFKKGVKTPIICDTIIQPTEIICDTNIKKGIFFKRYESYLLQDMSVFFF